MPHPLVDVIIPARRGSIGLPGKNRMMFLDRPLFMHSVACANLIPELGRIIISTDDPKVAAIAEEAGIRVPRLRPQHLATSHTPMAQVVMHEITSIQDAGLQPATYVLLLDPTSPLRDPDDVTRAMSLLCDNPTSVGAISISRPAFNPLWVGVTLDDSGRVSRHDLLPNVYSRRQDVADYWRINGSIYLWRWEFAAALEPDWLNRGVHQAVETSEIRSHSIDTFEDFRLAEVLVESGLVDLPWVP